MEHIIAYHRCPHDIKKGEGLGTIQIKHNTDTVTVWRLCHCEWKEWFDGGKDQSNLDCPMFFMQTNNMVTRGYNMVNMNALHIYGIKKILTHTQEWR